MLTITRGRTWSVIHTVRDGSPDGPLSDLLYIVEAKCQIRSKSQQRDGNGYFNQPLVVDVDVVRSGDKLSVFTLELSRSVTVLLPVGDYLVDVVGFDAAGNDESLLDPEPIRVINRPSHPVEEDALPDFVEIFENELLA